MISQRDTPLRKALRQAATLPERRPAEAFWQDFEARAALTSQEAPEALVVVGGGHPAWRWALAAAAAVVVLAVAALLLRPPARPLEVARVPPALPTDLPAALSKVEEVEVFAEYSSVMIVEDIENGGTVIWVASAAP